MRKRSWFKSDGEWTAVAHYLIPALGVLGLLAALILVWLRGSG